MLKSHDIYVLLKLVVLTDRKWNYAGLAMELRMSPSQIHSSIKRLRSAKLAVKEGNCIFPHFRNLEEFLIHGLKYCFWAEEGTITRGLPTSHGAPPLNKIIAFSSAELLPVWPDPDGEVRGIAYPPLHKTAPMASKKDAKFHEILSLVDALRMGRAREKKLAEKELHQRLSHYASTY